MDWYYDGDIQIKKLTIQPFGTNCYLVVCPRTTEGIIIDTPGEAWRILKEAENIRVKQIVITHTHLDHLGAFREIRDKLKVPVSIHRLEAEALPSPPEIFLEDGDMVTAGTLRFKVLHTPGHSPGSICLYTGKHLFSGDTIFPGGPGKTRNAEALEQIIQSITTKLFVLPDDTAVYPGHGDDAVLGEEKRKYAAFASRTRAPGLCGDVMWLTS